MNIFSDQLSSIIIKKGVSISQMASCCGVNRSTMYKIIKGSRRPSSERLVEDICGFLQLSPEESGLLMENYRILEMGPEYYRRRSSILAFLRDCMDSFPLPPAPEFGTSVFAMRDTAGVPVPLYGAERILNACAALMRQEMYKENGFLRLRFQPQEQFANLLKILCQSSGCTNTFHIQHIIVLGESPSPDDNALSNLALIRALLPVLKQLPDYKLFYYYEENHEKNQDYSFLPCLILSGNYALQFSEDLRFGLLHSHPKTITLMGDLYSNLLDACLPMTKEARDYRDALIYGKKRCAGHSAVSFQPFPSLNFLLTKELLYKYVKEELPERDFLINAALELQERNLNFYTSHSMTIIASEKGIRDYLLEGRIPVYLSSMYKSAEPGDKFLLIRRFRDFVRNYDLTFRLVRGSFGETASPPFIWIEDSYASFLFSNSSGGWNNLFFREPEIIACFLDFFSNMPDSLFFSKEKSLEILDGILEETAALCK